MNHTEYYLKNIETLFLKNTSSADNFLSDIMSTEPDKQFKSPENVTTRWFVEEKLRVLNQRLIDRNKQL